MRIALITLLICIISPIFSLNHVIILVGPPGSGKGTFAQHLKENFGYNHISCGDLVRDEIDKQTPIGLEIKDIVTKGEFIPSATMHALLEKAVTHMNKEEKPFIIDAFGRQEDDITYLHNLIASLGLQEMTIGIRLTADDSLCKERILHREICTRCSHVYNAITAPPQSENICDLCHFPLKKRLNDHLEIIEKRLTDYRSKVEYNQVLSILPYPCITFNTNSSLEDCLEFYSKLCEENHLLAG